MERKKLRPFLTNMIISQIYIKVNSFLSCFSLNFHKLHSCAAYENYTFLQNIADNTMIDKKDNW